MSCIMWMEYGPEEPNDFDWWGYSDMVHISYGGPTIFDGGHTLTPPVIPQE